MRNRMHVAKSFSIDAHVHCRVPAAKQLGTVQSKLVHLVGTIAA